MKFYVLMALTLLTACSKNKESLTFTSESLSVPAESSMATSYSFGEAIVEGSTVSDKTFTYKKSASAVESAGSSVILSNTVDFAIVSASGCNRDLVKASDICYPKIRLLKKVAGTYSALLQVGSVGNYHEISLSATVISPTPSALSLVLKEGSLEVQNVDFGLVDKNSTTTKTFSLTNSSSNPYPLTVSLTGSSFILSNNGCTSSLAAGKTCYLKITFKPGAGSVSDELKPGSLVLASNASRELSGTVRGNPPGAPNVKFYESSLEISSLDVGVLSSGSVTKVIMVKNTGNAANAASVILSGDSEFKQVSNTCSSSLAAGASCYVRVSFNYTQGGNGQKSSTLTAGSFSLSLTGTLQTVVANNPRLVYVFPSETFVIRSPGGEIECGRTFTKCTHEFQSPPASISLSLEELEPNYYINLAVYASSDDPSFNDLLSIDYLSEPYPNPFVFDLTTPGYIKAYLVQSALDDRGLVQVSSPISGRIYSDDGFLNCGNGNTQCSHQYPVDTTSISVSFADIDPAYELIDVYTTGQNAGTYGVNSPFNIALGSGTTIEANVQMIPMNDLTVRIRGGKGFERLNVSSPGILNEDCEGNCHYKIRMGSTITVTALANAGKNYESFPSCPGTVNANQCSFVLNNNFTVVGAFELGYTKTEVIVPPGDSFNPLFAAVMYQDLDNIYVFDYNTPPKIRKFDFITDTFSTIRNFGGANPQIIGKFGNKILLYDDYSEVNEVKLYTIDDTSGAINNIGTLYDCVYLMIDFNNIVRDSNSVVVSCAGVNNPDFTNSAISYLVNTSNSQISSVGSTIVQQGEFRVLDYDFVQGNEGALITHRTTPEGNRIIEKSILSEVLATVPAPGTFTMPLQWQRYNDSIFATYYQANNGIYDLWKIPLDLSSSGSIYHGGRGGFFIKNGKLYTGKGNNFGLFRINLATEQEEKAEAFFSSDETCASFIGNVTRDQNGEIIGMNCANVTVAFDTSENRFAIDRVFSDFVQSFNFRYLNPWTLQRAISQSTVSYQVTESSRRDTNGVILKVDSAIPRNTREIFKVDYSHMDFSGEPPIIYVNTVMALSDGRIVLEITEINYPGGSLINQQRTSKRIYLQPN